MIEFRNLSEKRQATFIKALKFPKETIDDPDGGGDYWVRSISGLSSAFRQNDNTLIKDKINDVVICYEATERFQTKKMYERNLEILHNYEDFDFSVWRPNSELKFLKRKSDSIVFIKGLPIQILPNFIFTFMDGDIEKVGAIWFVTKLEGFKLEDLGIFAESIFKYLKTHYSEYEVDPNHCLVIDSPSMTAIGYNQILNKEIPSLFEKTIDIMSKYWN